MMHKPTYRADIDGLRAFAVVAVILFHAELSLGPISFRGGFLGVDVFFVISGFLITSLLRREILETGRVSIAGFYNRRLRRIAPALIAVCLATILAAQFILLPQELERFNMSVLATLGFVANIFFWSETGYFAPAADQQPMLHMWSLAVEEQYYVIFPLALWAFVRWFGWRVTIVSIVAVTLASAALHAWGSVAMRSASFYLTPFRVWELLAGALVAMMGAHRERLTPLVASSLGVLGAGLVLVPLFAFEPLDAPSVFPVTLAAVAGTCMIILSGPQSAMGKILSWRPFVGLGLISYSLYLVHQPVFAFARVRTPEDPSETLMAGLALLCLPLGYASWRFVETPFRAAKRVGHRAFYGTLISTTTLVVAASLGAFQSWIGHGWSDKALEIANIVNAPTNGLSARCHGDLSSPECATDDAPRTILWGDSFAMHLAPGLVAEGVSFRQVTRRSCAPSSLAETRSPDDSRPRSREELRCEAFNAEVLAMIAAEASAGRLDTVLISAREYGVKAGSLRHIPTEKNRDPEQVEAELDVVLKRLWETGVSIGLITSPPPATFDPGQCHLRSVAYEDRSSDCTWPMPAAHAAYPLGTLAKRHGGHVLDVSAIICPGSECAATRGDVLIYRDNGHLTPAGAKYVFESDLAHQFLDKVGIARMGTQ